LECVVPTFADEGIIARPADIDEIVHVNAPVSVHVIATTRRYRARRGRGCGCTWRHRARRTRKVTTSREDHVLGPMKDGVSAQLLISGEDAVWWR
jgi:hypothetical protein